MIEPTQIESILRSDPNLNDSQRADIFDVFAGSLSHQHLADALDSMPVRIQAQTRDALVRARYEMLPVPLKAVYTLAALDRDDLERAESHPTVLRALMNSRSQHED